MKKYLASGVVFILVVVIAHVITLQLTPKLIMNKAIETMQARGVPLHKFVLSPRTTPQTQTIVRPSPDMAYTICLYDFSAISEPLEISVGYWPGYGSVSFYDAQTNNYSTLRIIDPEDADKKILLMPKAMQVPTDIASSDNIIISPTKRGIILIRRLAPSAETYAQVEIVSSQDQCRPISQE